MCALPEVHKYFTRCSKTVARFFVSVQPLQGDEDVVC